MLYISPFSCRSRRPTELTEPAARRPPAGAGSVVARYAHSEPGRPGVCEATEWMLPEPTAPPMRERVMGTMLFLSFSQSG